MPTTWEVMSVLASGYIPMEPVALYHKSRSPLINKVNALQVQENMLHCPTYYSLTPQEHYLTGKRRTSNIPSFQYLFFVITNTERCDLQCRPTSCSCGWPTNIFALDFSDLVSFLSSVLTCLPDAQRNLISCIKGHSKEF